MSTHNIPYQCKKRKKTPKLIQNTIMSAAMGFYYAPEGTSGGILKSHRPSVSPSVSPFVHNKSCLSDSS